MDTTGGWCPGASRSVPFPPAERSISTKKSTISRLGSRLIRRLAQFSGGTDARVRYATRHHADNHPRDSIRAAPALAIKSHRVFSPPSAAARSTRHTRHAEHKINPAAAGSVAKLATFRKVPLARPTGSLAKPCSIHCQNAQPKRE